MPLFQARELLPFPPNSDNATDTAINGIHFNKTALNHFNYTLYSNGTLSNGSSCFLTFDLYKPRMLSNGTFLNATTCYAPIEDIEARGSVGIAFAALFALTILFSLMNLRKHGRRFLPVEKRWSIVGRRWQWYWLLFLGACGTISCFMSIDVDRYYLQSLPIILQSIFYHIMLPVMLAAMWEGARHWGSWQERQIVDRDTFAFEAASTRERQELYMPFFFYLFGFLNFFLTIPRPWTSIQKQRSDEQQANLAMPTATDGRFKAASIVAIPCIIVICYNLGHSLYRYQIPPPGRSRVIFYATALPVKFTLVVILATIRVCFNIAAAFDFAISPLKYDGDPGWVYGLGYAPVLLVLLVLNLWGCLDPNEDRALIKQRVARGHAADVELGIEAGKRKPDWWRRMRMDFQPESGNDPNSRLQAMVNQAVDSGKPKPGVCDEEMEMGTIRHAENKEEAPQETQPRPTATTLPAERGRSGDRLANPEGRTNRLESNAGSQFTASSGDTLTSQAPPQKIRSMLDV